MLRGIDTQWGAKAVLTMLKMLDMVRCTLQVNSIEGRFRTTVTTATKINWSGVTSRESSKADSAVADIECGVHVLKEDIAKDPELACNAVVVGKTTDAS